MKQDCANLRQGV